MKLILTGSTGFIGTEILTQCRQNPSITSLVALSRRKLPDSVSSDPKLRTVIMDDFTSYSDEVLEACAGAEVCIWSLGIATPKSSDGNRRINLDYTLAAAKGFQKALAPRLADQGKKFRFVYCSGMMTERDQERKLWFMGEMRRTRGEVENQLLALAKEHHDTLQTLIVRPGAVLARGNRMPDPLIDLTRCVRVEELAAAMVGCAVREPGGVDEEKQIVENWQLRERGQGLLKKGRRGGGRRRGDRIAGEVGDGDEIRMNVQRLW